MTRLRAPDPSLSSSGGRNNSAPAPPTSQEPRIAANSIRVHTPAFYRGLPVTVIGRVDEVLLAVVAYATPFELAVGVIASEDHGAGERYRVTGHDRAVATLDVAAGLAAPLQQQRDRGER